MRTKTDFDYERKRNYLIPHASAVANEQCGEKPKDGNVEAWGRNWNQVYFATMDRLAKEAELFK